MEHFLIETGLDKSGTSIILSHQSHERWGFPGYKISDLYFSTSTPPNPSLEGDKLGKLDFNLKPGEVRFFQTIVNPTLPIYESLKPSDKPSLKRFYYHSTSTIDFVTVIKGELVLIVGDQETLVKAGDTIIQRCAGHAWHNYTEKDAVIGGVMIGVVPPKSFIRIDSIDVDEINSHLSLA